MEKLEYKRIHIPRPDRHSLIKTCGSLPYNASIELGGYLTTTSILYTEGTRENVPVMGSHETVFHTHPNRDRADIPSELDVLNLMMLNWKTSIILTPHQLIVMSKTPETESRLNDMERIHDRHVLDVATLLRRKGPDSVFYYLVKKMIRTQAHRFRLSHRNWEHTWEAFVRDGLQMDLKTWACIPISCAA
ncbi:MAG: hypothetical protein V1913_09000 [Fibrobacterota bacterium]